MEWVGLACFRIWEDGGTVIVTDPFPPDKIGIDDEEDRALRLRGDVVVCSSLTDVAHNHYKIVDGEPRVIDALQDLARGGKNAEINGEPVVAVEATESEEHPEGADANALYAFKVGGLWVLHMGDVGFGLPDERIAPFKGKSDILLALTGEALTLKLEDLDPIIDYLDPTWVIPMHYNVAPVSGFEPFIMTKIDAFLDRRSGDPVVFPRDHTVSFPMDTVALGRPTIVVLEPSGYKRT